MSEWSRPHGEDPPNTLIGGLVMEKRKISAKEVARDIQAGMGDTPLMEKYNLSAKQLETVLRKLIEADLIDHMQLYERTTLSDAQITKAFVDTQATIKELD